MASSLKSRMQKRRDELENRTTEIFPVPRWDSVLAVELRAITWRTTEQIIERNQRVPASTTATSAGDEIVKATVAFYEIDEETGDLELVEEGEDGQPVTWRQIASGVLELPEGSSDRVALIALAGDQGVMALSGLYRRWLGGAETGIKSMLRQDFPKPESQ